MDAGKTLIGGLGSDAWFGMLVAGADVVADSRLERTSAAMHAATQFLLGQQSEPALDQIDARGADGREVQVKAWGFANQRRIRGV